MFEKIDWIQEVEAPVTVVVELETLDQVRLHSKGLRDCSKFREWALEAQYLGTLVLFFFVVGGISMDNNAIDDNNDDLITMIIAIMIMIILIKAVLDKQILKCIDR